MSVDDTVIEPTGAEDQGPGTRDVIFNEALSERYLAYALSTIMSRSLPDVRDGLKPVQRRCCMRCGNCDWTPMGLTRKVPVSLGM